MTTHEQIVLAYMTYVKESENFEKNNKPAKLKQNTIANKYAIDNNTASQSFIQKKR